MRWRFKIPAALGGPTPLHLKPTAHFDLVWIRDNHNKLPSLRDVGAFGDALPEEDRSQICIVTIDGLYIYLQHRQLFGECIVQTKGTTIFVVDSAVRSILL